MTTTVSAPITAGSDIEGSRSAGFDPTGSEVVQAVAGLAAGFRERRPQTNAQRRIPIESMDEIRETGMLRMLVPREHGGLQLTIRDFVDATAAAARGCPSTGWCAGQMAFAALVFAASPVRVQQTIWGRSANVRSASTAQGLTATPAPGGFVLSGKGAFASGIDHAEWLYLGAPVKQDGQVLEQRFFLVRRDQVSVLDTWDTTAMRGTGSNTVALDDAFIEEAFSVRHADLREGTGPGVASHSGSLYSLPWVAVVPLIYVSTMLGATQAAYDTMLEALSVKLTPSGQRAAESEQLQLEVSFVKAQIDAAQVQLHAAAARADSGIGYTIRDRAAAMRDACFVTSQLVEAIDGVLAICGTRGFDDTNFIQQAWSDVHFAATHQSLNKRLAGSRFGRMELGLEDAVLPVFY